MPGCTSTLGRLVVVLTPELRQLALDHVRETEQGEDEENLTRWFQEQETPDGYVLDASSCEAEAHMIVVIARALLWQFTEHHDDGVTAPDDLDAEVRTISRYR